MKQNTENRAWSVRSRSDIWPWNLCDSWAGGVYVCVGRGLCYCVCNSHVKTHMVFRLNLHELTHWTFIFHPWGHIIINYYFDLLHSGSVINHFTFITWIKVILYSSANYIKWNDSILHSFRGNQNRELAHQWLEKLNDQWELQRFLQDCHEVGGQRTGCTCWLNS